MGRRGNLDPYFTRKLNLKSCGFGNLKSYGFKNSNPTDLENKVRSADED